MRTIYSPHPDLPDADRLSACRQALEPAVWQVIDRAKDAGWTGTEAALAAVLVMADRAEQESRAWHAGLMLEVG